VEKAKENYLVPNKFWDKQTCTQSTKYSSTQAAFRQSADDDFLTLGNISSTTIKSYETQKCIWWIFYAWFWKTFSFKSGFTNNNQSSFNLLKIFKKFKFLVVFNMMQNTGCYSRSSL
jgi:hypothetical protein